MLSNGSSSFLLPSALSLKICANLRNLWMISTLFAKFAFWWFDHIFRMLESPANQ